MDSIMGNIVNGLSFNWHISDMLGLLLPIFGSGEASAISTNFESHDLRYSIEHLVLQYLANQDSPSIFHFELSPQHIVFCQLSEVSDYHLDTK